MTRDTGKVHCTLVCGKAKLAPLKQLTIPRLELVAAVLALRVDRQLKEHLDVTVDKTVFWTDSNIVLGYIRNSERRFRTFVANRVAQIRKNTTTEQWRHVTSCVNPCLERTVGCEDDAKM